MLPLINRKRKKYKTEDNNEIELKEIGYKLVILFIILLISYESCSIILKDIEKEKNFKYFFCFASIGKLENVYVREMVDYYKNIGVDKFILGDNNDKNSEKLSDVLQKDIDEGLVDILEYIGQKKHQTDFFKDSYRIYGDQCRWISYYDFDEFLELREGNKQLTVQQYFSDKKFEKCDVILVNWVLYGDDDLLHYEEGLITERFTTGLFNASDNVFVKSIVKGNLRFNPWEEDQTSHRPNHHKNTCYYNGERAKTFNDVIRPPLIKDIYLKHYATKTVEEYILNKLKRGYTSVVLTMSNWVDNFFKLNKVTEEKVRFIEKSLNMTFPKYHYIFEKNTKINN